MNSEAFNAHVRHFKALESSSKKTNLVDEHIRWRSEAVSALRRIVEAQQALENAMDAGEVVVDRLNELDNPEAA
jgi:predicted Rossmann fold nucleotide-binding protein DprA/Smf involved in DNA uptake